uniref:Uncharacterized protein n=1 Tax=Romanomermis culicivorax TaxID=13658 RepID=A0A915K038_ROMCU
MLLPVECNSSRKIESFLDVYLEENARISETKKSSIAGCYMEFGTTELQITSPRRDTTIEQKRSRVRFRGEVTTLDLAVVRTSCFMLEYLNRRTENGGRRIDG